MNIPIKFKGYPRHQKNPFRPNTTFGTLVDILANHPQGMNRFELLKQAVKVTGKPEQSIRYAISIICSANYESNRHRSCKDGFQIHRENDYLRIVFQ